MGGLRLAVEWRALVSVGRCLLLEFACITTRTTRMKGVSLGTVVRVSAPASDGRVEKHFESVLQMSYISCPYPFPDDVFLPSSISRLLQ